MKSKVPLVVAIVIGVGSLWAIYSYVQKRGGDAPPPSDQGRLVVVAERDIPAGTELTRNMVTLMRIPDHAVPADAIPGGSVHLVPWRRTRAPLKAGQPLRWSDLVADAAPGLSSVIPPGNGAYTIPVPKGVKPGLIQPGDRIDIIATLTMPRENQTLLPTAATWRQGPETVNVVLLQNVRVLATGDTIAGAGRPGRESVGDLTLSVTLPEAQLLMFAAQHGELGAVLRPEGATTVHPRGELPKITVEDMEKIISDLDARRNPTPDKKSPN